MFTVLELFAGAGGLALGFEQAGLQAVGLIEWDKHAAQTLRLNRPAWPVIEVDVRDIDFSVFESPDILAAGFPCQPFSVSGLKRGFADTRGTLFYDVARAVEQLNPKIVVLENVKYLLHHDNGRTLTVIKRVLKGLGYFVYSKVLNAVNYEVPQNRERLFIVAVREDIPGIYTFPKNIPGMITLREALSDVPASEGSQYPTHKKAVLDLVPEGGNWRNLPVDVQKQYMGKGYYQEGGRTSVAKRLAWDEPAPTILCSPAQHRTERCHPSETRPLTVRESARIQTFPDTWVFSGGQNAQYKQIGNAVPVKLAYHVGLSLVQFLES